MKLALLIFGSMLVALTIMSRVRSARWCIRLADFPRLQIAIALTLTGIVYAFHLDPDHVVDLVFVGTIVASLAYQCFRIFPYTPIAPRQVIAARNIDDCRRISILISNVLMQNRRANDFLSLVHDYDPDLILAMETDDWWDTQLRVLDRDYAYGLKKPQDNEYGIHLFSRLELRNAAVRFLVDDDVPSVRADVILRSGEVIEFYGLHPRPPLPQQDTVERDAELLILGRMVRSGGKPSIVAGDLNDVAWSHTNRLFQRISGLLDPRRGRGTYSTFHAGWPVLRWPLDHVFHDGTFTLIRLQCLRNIGSDHFPVLVELLHEPGAVAAQDVPEADREDRQEARERIAELSAT